MSEASRGPLWCFGTRADLRCFVFSRLMAKLPSGLLLDAPHPHFRRGGGGLQGEDTLRVPWPSSLLAAQLALPLFRGWRAGARGACFLCTLCLSVCA